MAETKLLTKHEDIRAWAAARAGVPALSNPPSFTDQEPELLLLFGETVYEDQDHGADPPMEDAPELVEWDEWLRLFDERHLALVVAEEEPGHLDQFHELVRR